MLYSPSHHTARVRSPSPAPSAAPSPLPSSPPPPPSHSLFRVSRACTSTSPHLLGPSLPRPARVPMRASPVPPAPRRPSRAQYMYRSSWFSLPARVLATAPARHPPLRACRAEAVQPHSPSPARAVGLCTSQLPSGVPLCTSDTQYMYNTVLCTAASIQPDVLRLYSCTVLYAPYALRGVPGVRCD